MYAYPEQGKEMMQVADLKKVKMCFLSCEKKQHMTSLVQTAQF